MFWNSILEGFLILLNYKIWLFITVYAGLTTWYYNKSMNKLIDNSNPTAIASFGVAFVIKKNLLDSILIVFIIGFIAPILFGVNKLNSISNIFSSLIPILIVSTIIAGLRVVWAAFGSFKNQFSEGGGYGTSFICMILILVISQGSISEYVEFKDSEDIKTPSFLFGAGLFLITLPMIWLFTFVFGIVVSALKEDTREIIIKAVLVSSGLIFGIVFMRMYASAVININGGSPIVTTEKIRDNVNWKQRIENDASTIFDLMNLASSSSTDIDDIKMQIERFSNKISEYPLDKQDTLKKITKMYIRYYQAVLSDLGNYCTALLEDDHSDGVVWSVTAKPIADSFSLYNISNQIIGLSQLDSIAVGLMTKASFGEKDQVETTRDNLIARIPTLTGELKDTYYRIFREKYE